MPLRMPSSRRLVTLAAALFSIGAAQAHVVSAELNSIRFEVVDLDLSDGQVPSLNLRGLLSAQASSLHESPTDSSKDFSTGDVDETSAWPRARDVYTTADVRHRSLASAVGRFAGGETQRQASRDGPDRQRRPGFAQLRR